MISSSPVVLGIDPGARQIGVSVIQGERLILYAVKTFRKGNCENSLLCLREIIKNLVHDYQIEFVALEKVVFVQQHHSFVKIVYEEIKTFLEEQNVKFVEYNPKQIRQAICGLENPSNRNTALILSQKYGELVRYFDVPRLWQRRYYALLFGAIAASLVGACVIEEKKKKLELSNSTKEY
jgi:Holliday junction resolvasome RuvABC endonuclease subunit